MNFIKEKWTKKDLDELIKYLDSIKKVDKITWTRNIVNTKLPLFAIPNPELKSISKEILKGNYLSYLEICDYTYYDLFIISASIINRIKDYDTLEKVLSKYVTYCECWSSTDAISIVSTTMNDQLFLLAKEYIQSDKPFIKRTGYRLLFKFCNNLEVVDEIYRIIDLETAEENYYVNMIIAWLLCELMIKQRSKTLTYLDNHHLSKFVVNKFVSKCRDSFRVSNEDKELLVKYRVK